VLQFDTDRFPPPWLWAVVVTERQTSGIACLKIDDAMTDPARLTEEKESVCCVVEPVDRVGVTKFAAVKRTALLTDRRCGICGARPIFPVSGSWRLVVCRGH
jgi:hypothetical protein